MSFQRGAGRNFAGWGESIGIELEVRRKGLGERLRFGGATSSSTAGVLACQWTNATKTISVQPGSCVSPTRLFNTKYTKKTKRTNCFKY